MGLFNKIFGSKPASAEQIDLFKQKLKSEVDTIFSNTGKHINNYAMEIDDSFLDIYSNEKKWTICALFVFGYAISIGEEYKLSEEEISDNYLLYLTDGDFSQTMRSLITSEKANFDMEEKCLTMIAYDFKNKKWQGSKDAHDVLIQGQLASKDERKNHRRLLNIIGYCERNNIDL